MTRQTETRHWETLSERDFCPKYTGGYLTSVLTVGHSGWDGSLSSHFSQQSQNKQLTTTNQLNVTINSFRQLELWGLCKIKSWWRVSLAFGMQKGRKGSWDGVPQWFASQTQWLIWCKQISLTNVTSDVILSSLK